MRITAITLFPELVEAVVRVGMPRVAVENGALSLEAINPRDFSTNRWRRVDDRPFGGGPGMVMQAEPIAAAITAATTAEVHAGAAIRIGLSPQGERLTQGWVERLAREPVLVLVCGRYEGIDERLVPSLDVELSIGDYVLSGGELAAMVLIDALARLLPGVLGHEASAKDDSFSTGFLDHPHFTRPEVWRGESVPEVLMSGDHAAIRRWRLKQALGRTWLKRPDLLEGVTLEADQLQLLRDFIAEQQ